MIGVIRKRDIFSHPLVTIQCFGWRIFTKALLSGRSQTFLSLLSDTGAFEGRSKAVPEQVEACIQLELRAKRLYQHLARQFHKSSHVHSFFLTLAQQEQEHAELLQLCRQSTGEGQWIARHFEPYASAVPELEDGMQEAESGLEKIRSIADGLRRVIQIESSEINDVFQSIISASGSKFVRAMGSFQSSIETHLSYICENIPKISPALKEECRLLYDRHHARADSLKK